MICSHMIIKQNNNLKGLIIGCGSIGERHLHNLLSIGIKNMIIYDKDEFRVNQLSKKYNVKKSTDINSALSFEPNFTFICTYPDSHLKIANQCLNANSHLFIEKPLASELNGVERILKQAESKNLQIAVGYNMRFHKGLIILKEYLKRSAISKPITIFAEWGNNIKQWRPGMNYTNHYVLKKGGGIILDASHEYDYVRWLLDDEIKSVYCKTGKTTAIKTETESNAVITLTFKKGAIANIILDYVRPQYERRCHIIGEKGDLKWEYKPKLQSWKKYDSKANAKVTLNLLNGKKLTKNFVSKTNEMYIDEAKSFINSIIHNKKPVVDGWDGLKTLKVGYAALNSAKSNKPVML